MVRFKLFPNFRSVSLFSSAFFLTNLYTLNAQDIGVDQSEGNGIRNYSTPGRITAPKNSTSVIFSGSAQVSFRAAEVVLNDGFRVMELSENGYFIANSEVVTSSQNGSESSSFESLQTFPNPVHERLTINFKEGSTFSYSLIDVVGHETLKGVGRGPSQIDVSQLESGIYFLEVTTDEEVPRKFLKKIFVEL